MSDIRYDRLFENALRDVICHILKQVSKEGLPGKHYFQITFATTARGVVMAQSLKNRFPKTMTIVLQHRFEQLKAGARSFSVVLYFANRSQLIEVPYNAIMEFTDPEAKFSLQFQGFSVPQKKAQKASKKPAIPKNPALVKLAAEKVVKLDEYRKAKN